jgi:protein-tyrosine-phosphatase
MHILFVCTGNTCRSAMAGAMARATAADLGLADCVIGSAGTNAWEGQPASDGALLVGLERQLSLDTHRSRLVTRELVASQDLILAMGPHHVEQVEALGGTGKTFLLSAYASHDADQTAISDPFGGDLETYRQTADALEAAVRRVLTRVAAERAPDRP